MGANTEHCEEHLGQRLAYEDVLPLSYQVVNALPTGNEHLALQQSNEEILHAIMMVEDAPKESLDESNIDAMDFLRLEHKMNIMFELLVGLYQREVELPTAVSVVLRSDAIQWHGEQPVEVGSPVLVELYMSRKYPKPLSLPGTVTAVSGESTPLLLTMAFGDAVSDRTRDWIDKFIFRHHRRAIALARRQSNGIN